MSAITKDDVRDWFASFVAAIELDQIRVDALSAKAFHCHYSDSMWRQWRRDHVQYLNLLLATVELLRPATLDGVTWIATNYQPKVIRERAIDLLGYAVSESIDGGGLDSAELFFHRLIEEVSSHSDGAFHGQDARAQMMQWLSVTDPLKIAEDPECGYQLGVYAAS